MSLLLSIIYVKWFYLVKLLLPAGLTILCGGFLLIKKSSFLWQILNFTMNNCLFRERFVLLFIVHDPLYHNVWWCILSIVCCSFSSCFNFSVATRSLLSSDWLNNFEYCFNIFKLLAKFWAEWFKKCRSLKRDIAHTSLSTEPFSVEKSKVGDLSRGWPKGSLFNSYSTEV